jgi:hypothetical protein
MAKILPGSIRARASANTKERIALKSRNFLDSDKIKTVSIVFSGERNGKTFTEIMAFTDCDGNAIPLYELHKFFCEISNQCFESKLFQ